MTNMLQQVASSYLTITQLHETAEGEPCYIAYHPELPNCIGQGSTPKEAEEDLAAATELTLQYLHDTEQLIPEARWLTGSMPIVSPTTSEVFGCSNAYPGSSELRPAPLALI
jgi:predicted RNase H-like HicB family nuclease